MVKRKENKKAGDFWDNKIDREREIYKKKKWHVKETFSSPTTVG